MWKILDVESKIGTTLTESVAMWPPSSVSALVFAQGEYFAVGKLGKDQIADYAARKGMPVNEVENWLAANLAYATSE